MYSMHKSRGGKKLKIIPKQIIARGAGERYVVDGWQIYDKLSLESGYKWVIDIIDYFNKYMASFPITDNNAKNALLSIKEFCIFIAFPKILQTDNGAEYCNNLIDNFCMENNIQYITSIPRHPQKNGVIETIQREIRRKIMIDYSNSMVLFDLKNSLLEVFDIHNHNIHS